MSDIVERLRSHHETPSVRRSHPEICDEAADEIKRLRAENLHWEHQNALLEAENERMRAIVVGGDRALKASHLDADRYRAEIERLRIWDDPGETICADAAAEIERLRKINDDLAHAVAWMRAALSPSPASTAGSPSSPPSTPRASSPPE